MTDSITKTNKEIRDDEIILMIQRQTNYTEKETKEKLMLWDNNYINVIKEYVNPDFRQEKKIPVKSTNQQVMSEIRNFMDVATKGYENRKKQDEIYKEKRQQYIRQYNQQINIRVKQACTKWTDAPKSCWLDREVVGLLMKYGIDDKQGISGKTFHDYHFIH